jgi:hypothetical protein
MELWLIGESMGGIDVESLEEWWLTSLAENQRSCAKA